MLICSNNKYVNKKYKKPLGCNLSRFQVSMLIINIKENKCFISQIIFLGILI